MTLAKIAIALASARRLEEIDQIVRGSVVPWLAADEFILDISSHDLSRAPLIGVGIQEAWAKRYNLEFHRLNPTTATIKSSLEDKGVVVRRFADLSREPLLETRFYQEYMQPQGHRYSLVAALSLEGAGNLTPTLTMLAVRHETRPEFSDDDVAALEILLPATAWGIHCAMRSSDEWTQSVIQAAFALPPKLAEVTLLLAKGMSNAEIAASLDVTVGTVKQYVHQILEMTGAGSRTDLCRLILG